MLEGNVESERWTDLANEFLPRYDITTPERIASFFSQTAHESQNYKVLSENLNYSAQGLLSTFPRYFTQSLANQYARKPVQIANRVYANRMGNGSEASGDGWKYRGGGLIQLTGKNNQSAFGRDIGMSVNEVSDYIRTVRGAFHSAVWFWDTNNLNRFADREDINGLTRAINGGTNGLNDRIRRYNRDISVLRSPSTKASNFTPLSNGSRSEYVKNIQSKLGLAADGIFGPKTSAAVISFQAKNGYKPDGVVTVQVYNAIIGS